MFELDDSIEYFDDTCGHRVHCCLCGHIYLFQKLKFKKQRT